MRYAGTMEQIRAETAIEHRNPGAPRLPTHPFRGLFVGESGCGKTHAVVEHLILDPQSPFDRVIWVAPAPSLEQPMIQRLVELHEPEEGSPQTLFLVPGLSAEGMEEVDELIEAGFADGQQTLLVIDDCICCEGNKRAIQQWVDRQFTSGRHRNQSTVMLTQRIFTPESRMARINTDVFWVSSFSDKREAKQLFQQLSPAGFAEIMQAYRHATVGRGPGSALYIDKQAEKSPNPSHRVLRFRQCGSHADGTSRGLKAVYSNLKDIE